MGREQKKGRAGNAKAYITRAKALKKLQLSLPEWRRLCIIKGIYPRDPKKKTDGQDKTYYLRKDVDFLAHERLIDTIRAQATHRRKVVKARSKKQLDVLRSLALRKPRTNLHHIIAERFPRFGDALREIDDPLCVIALFATLPAVANLGISAHRVANCRRLLNEFLNFVAHTRALRRVFVSIKGYYYQAEIDGELITWVAPHRFTQTLPSDVDYSVMLTFLELYECLMNFVNFRLYTQQNLAYPPKIDDRADASGRDFGAVVLAKKEAATGPSKADPSVKKPAISSVAISEALASATANRMEEESDEEEIDDAEAAHGEDEGKDAQDVMAEPAHGTGAEVDSDIRSASVGSADPKADAQDAPKEAPVVQDDDDDEAAPGLTLLFDEKVVVLGRETPTLELEFVLKSAGASKVLRQDDVEQDSKLLDEVAYWIVDRPAVSGQRVLSIEYVQPQFVFDSLNAGVLLPPGLYAPGARLPPHLSPFVGDEEDGGYRPWFKDVIDRLKAGDTSVMTEAAVTAYMQSSAQRAGKPHANVGEARTSKKSSKKRNGVASSPAAPGLEPEGEKDGESIRAGARRADAGPDPGISDVNASSAQESHVEKGMENSVVSDEEAEIESDSASESDDDASDDDESDVVEANESAEVEAEQEKELKLLMLSRKKSKQYAKYAKEERLRRQRKASLTEKRSRATDGGLPTTSASKRRKVS